MSFLDNGAQFNTITLKYISDHSLQVGPITNLISAKVACIGLGNIYMRLLGYVVIWVQVDRVQGYDEESDSPSNPRSFQFCSPDPSLPGNTHYWLSC